MGKYKAGDWLIWLSIVAAVVSGFVFFTKMDVFNLAGTQWILIAIVLGIYGLYFKNKMSA
jgi:hypothetical protein